MEDTIAHQDREHSEHGASGYYRWANCAASVLASRGAKNSSSHAARLGTAAHEVAEECLREGFEALDFLGNTKVIDGETITLDETTLENVQSYVDHCLSHADEADDLETFTETRFDLDKLSPPAPMFGTTDYMAYSPALKTLWVDDYKNGWLNVPAESGQPKYYAIGGTVYLGPTRPVKRIICSIVQPNSGGIKTIEYKPAELAAWWRDTKVKVAATLNPDAPFNPGPWCEFCPVAGRCKARADADLQKVSMDFRRLMANERPPEMELRLMSPEEMGRFLAFFVSLVDTAAAVRKEVFRLEAQGTDVPGWKLVDKRAVRKFVGKDAEVVGLLAKAGISPWTERELISPAEAERRLMEGDLVPGVHKTKKAMKEAASKIIGVYVEKKSSGVTLAPDADPRPAVQAGDEFGEVPGEDNL